MRTRNRQGLLYRILTLTAVIMIAVAGIAASASVSAQAENYGGYYMLGDPNGYTYSEGEEFARYRFARNGNADFEEYVLRYAVSDADLQSFGGAVKFYIGDGETKYRRPGELDIELTEAGEYEILFSPTHDYGRSHNYRKTLLSSDPVARTIRISSTEDFLREARLSADGEYTRSVTFELTADLDFQNREIEGFRLLNGTFDGCFHTIRNFRIAGAADGASLFREIGADGVLKRVSFENLSIAAKDFRYIGLVSKNYGMIETVRASGSIMGAGYVGLVGHNAPDAVVRDSENACTVRGVVNTGGIVGFNEGTVEDCENTGAIDPERFANSDATASVAVGGVAGYSTGKIYGCVNRGAVGILDQGNYAGGIAGFSNGELAYARNYAPIAGDSSVGGIVGFYGKVTEEQSDELQALLEGTQFEDIVNEYFGKKNVTRAEPRAQLSVLYCVNTGDVTAQTLAGGIAGAADGVAAKVAYVASVARIEARGGTAGGAVGYLGAGTLTDAMTAGSVIGKSGTLGGVAGASAGTIRACMSAAEVRGNGAEIGGIAGRATAVENCYSAVTLSVENAAKTGMIAGTTDTRGNFLYNYFTGGGYGIDGANYGYSDAYAAAFLAPEDLVSEGELSAKLVGFDSGHWVGACTEQGYPTLRGFEEMQTSVDPDLDARFEQFRGELISAAKDCTAQRMTVTFYRFEPNGENHVYSEAIRVPYGSAVTEWPPASELENYFTWWEAELDCVTENIPVYERYSRIKTSLYDSAENPSVFVEGKFFSDSALLLACNGNLLRPVVLRGETEIPYHTVTVRYRVGTPDNYRIMIADENGVRQATAAASGEYLVFELRAGEWFEAVSINSPVNWRAWTIAAGSVAGALAVAVVILLIAAKKRKKAVAISECAEQTKDLSEESESDQNNP